MRKIKEIIIHCSATREGRDYTVADIDRWHRERSFFCIGYHFVIYRDGSILPVQYQSDILPQTGNPDKGNMSRPCTVLPVL